MHPLLRTWPETQACALTGNCTSNLLVHRPALSPLSHTSQGKLSLFILNLLRWHWFIESYWYTFLWYMSCILYCVLTTQSQIIFHHHIFYPLPFTNPNLRSSGNHRAVGKCKSKLWLAVAKQQLGSCLPASPSGQNSGGKGLMIKESLYSKASQFWSNSFPHALVT